MGDLRRVGSVLAIAGVILSSCGGDDDTSADDSTAIPESGPIIDPGDGGNYSVEIDPADFTSQVDNPFDPMLPGSKWVYRETDPDGEVEIITVEVLDEVTTVMGVETNVVHDRVETENGELVEDTYDWFAQDADGNVWYFGEDTKAYEDDGTVSEEGAWEAGVDDALPGIVMYADPEVSSTGYRQEFQAGEAEDMGQVIGVVRGAVVTRDWTPLEYDVIEEKTYVRGIGFVHEDKIAGEGAGATAVLLEFTAGD
jgi:hypothetical protein